LRRPLCGCWMGSAATAIVRAASHSSPTQKGLACRHLIARQNPFFDAA
jgi:hypothetical protein